MSGLPSNIATCIAYSGMNIMLLWCCASEQGFGDSRWMNYKQSKAEGDQVRKGEHRLPPFSIPHWKRKLTTEKLTISRC